MKQPAVVRGAPHGPASSSSGAVEVAPAIDDVGLYQAPRVALVAQFLQQYGEQRPIPVAEILPVVLMNYGEAEFRHAQHWFEAGEGAPGASNSPSLIDVGAGFGPAGLVFGSRHYRVTAIELQADIAAMGERVVQACGLEASVRYSVGDVMAFTPAAPADTLVAVLCLLHLADKVGAMRKLAALLRVGGRAYFADFYAREALSPQEKTLLREEVACPGLLTRSEYVRALQEAGFAIVRFEDATSEYSAFVHRRWATYRQQDASAQCDALTRFFAAMDTLYQSGDGASSRLGGCRVYLER